MESFVKRLNRIMKQNKLTKSDLSRMTGIATSSISDWATGKYLPKQDKVHLLAKALNVSPSWLIGYGEDDEYSNIKTIQFNNEKLVLLFDSVRDLTDEEIESIQSIVNQIRKAKGLDHDI